MKKAMWLSGILTIVFLTLLLAGFADKDEAVNKPMRLGNLKYDSAAYGEALDCYETGLDADPENGPLSFNAAQAAYMLGEYKKAVDYYDGSTDEIEKFLNKGNIYYYVGEIQEDDNDKMQCYLQSMQSYYDGIILFSQNIPLKYNYEYVKDKVDELSDKMKQDEQKQQEQKPQDGSGDNGGDSDEDSGGGVDDAGDEDSGGDENGGSGDNSDENDGADNGDESNGNEDEGDKDNSAVDGSEEDDKSDSSGSVGDENDGGDSDSDAGNSDSGDNACDSAGADDADQGNADQGNAGVIDGGSVNSGQDEHAQDMEAVNRILLMLEGQEEESLKNNQEIVGGKDEKYGW